MTRQEIIRNPNFIKDINPKYVSSYLNLKGWNQEKIIADRASIWILPSKQDNEDNYYEILLPLQSSIQDYAIRISEVLQTLSIVENRPVIEIINEINNIDADIIRIRVEYPDITDNTIHLDDGIRLFDSTKQLMYSISSSVVNPRPFFQGGRSKKVTDYMEKLRIGQTEPGSYIIKIISPVSDPLSDNFERQVIKKLFNALEITNNFPENIEEGEKLVEIVDTGISSNFCDAILKMSQGVSKEGIQFNLSRSKNTELPSNVSSEIKINVDALPRLKEAKEKLKSKGVVTYFHKRDKRRTKKSSPIFQEPSQTESLYKVEGKVIKLEWGEEDKKGRVTIITSIQGNTQESEIVIELNRADYKKAFEANLNQSLIICTGNLIEEKNQLIIRDVRSFTIE